jgi:hypothetical protein
MSAEGVLRCGKVPSCNVKRCTTSADCADLGEGYFCDTPNSGCCADSEQQRCLAPCEAAPCPPERSCGDLCCPEGQSCINGACTNPGTGTWDGTLTYEQQVIGVRFILEEADDLISGRILLRDPISQEYLETGAINGNRSGNQGQWQTESGSVVEGTFAQDQFTGSYTFADFNEEIGIEAALVLQRAHE